jgi:hypothetical protein
VEINHGRDLGMGMIYFLRLGFDFGFTGAGSERAATGAKMKSRVNTRTFLNRLHFGTTRVNSSTLFSN